MRLKKEREFYEELKPSLNIFKPMRTKEEIIEYQKEHYQKNIEVISIRHKTYRDEHAEQFRQDRKDNPEKYRERDRQKLFEKTSRVF